MTRAKLNALYGCSVQSPTPSPYVTPIPTPIMTPSPTPTISPAIIFTASNSETGQNYDTSSTINLPYGQIVNFTYSSTNATSCNTYANSTLMNSTTIGLTQGATSGVWQGQPKPGMTVVYTVTCWLNGQQSSKIITVSAANSTTTLAPIVTLTAAGGAAGPMVQVQSGAPIDLRWTSINANNGCSISSTPNDSSIAVTNKLPANSTITVRPTVSTTYTITCYYVDSNYQTTQGSNSITLNVANPAQLLGTLIPSTTFVNYNLVQGHSAQPTQITLTNASTSLINFTISVPNQPAWLNASYNTQPMSLQAGGVMGVGVSVDTTKVSGPGTYTTNLVFTGNFANSPITIPITLTVASQASLPVSVVSPNGGETLTVGQTYQIKWNAPSDPVSQNMQITLANSDTGELTQIGNSCIEQGVTAPVPSSDPNARYLQGNCSGLTAPVQNTGSYTWTVPTTLPSGSHYYIYVGELKIMGDGDFSNSAFSIAQNQ